MHLRCKFRIFNFLPSLPGEIRWNQFQNLFPSQIIRNNRYYSHLNYLSLVLFWFLFCDNLPYFVMVNSDKVGTRHLLTLIDWVAPTLSLTGVTSLNMLPLCSRPPSERRQDPVFYDTKIERAGGREVVSRSRSTRHKRNSTRDSLYHRAHRSQDLKNSDSAIIHSESHKPTGSRSSLINSR